MSLIRNPRMPRFVPEKYDKNQFTATAWYHIDRHYRHKGEHLTYEKFRQLQDPLAKQCHQHVFEDVLRGYQLDLVLAPEPPAPPPIRIIDEDQPTLKQNLGDALIDGLKKQHMAQTNQAPAAPKREPITAARRHEAAKWIEAHLNEGFAGFKAVFEDPELDFAWFTKTRGEALRKEQEQPSTVTPAPTESTQPLENSPMAMSVADMKFDPRVKPPVIQACKYLLTLGTIDRIRGMTHSVFAEKSKQKCEYHQFNKARDLVIRYLQGAKDKRFTTNGHTAPAPAKADAPAVATAAAPAAVLTRAPRASKAHNPYAGRTALVTLASISTAPVQSVEPSKLRSFVLDLLKQIKPEDTAPEIVFMTDPPTMEIRAKVQL